MSDGRQTNNRKHSAKFWAWTISISVHVLMLGIFGVVTFSQWQEAEKQRAVPVANVGWVRQMADAEPAGPKPKVNSIITNRAASMTVTVAKDISSRQIFDVSRPILRGSDSLAKASVSAPQGVMVLSNSTFVSPKVEFFGSITEGRKICYVVDCSGSMCGTFGRVQKELIESIEDLPADHYFYIVFFSDKLFEFGGGKLIRATPQAKSAAHGFITSVHAAGATNAAAALQRAMQIRDGAGAAPAIIYFLTDGFELTGDSADRFAGKVSDVRKNLAPTTKINTIGFWVQKSDGSLLEKIARASGGECTLISD